METSDAKAKVLTLDDVEHLPGCGFEEDGQFLMTNLKFVEKPVLVATVTALETMMMARDEMASRLESMKIERDAAIVRLEAHDNENSIALRRLEARCGELTLKRNEFAQLSEDRRDLVCRLEARCRTLTQDADEKRAWMMARDEMASRLESMTRSRDAADKAFEESQRKLAVMETEQAELIARIETAAKDAHLVAAERDRETEALEVALNKVHDLEEQLKNSATELDAVKAQGLKRTQEYARKTLELNQRLTAVENERDAMAKRLADISRIADLT